MAAGGGQGNCEPGGRGVRKLVRLPQGKKALKSKMCYDTKHDGRKKCRFVVKGYSQVYGVDFDEVFSPTAKFTTIRLVLAIAAAMDLDIEGMDVDQAFVNADLEPHEQLIIEPPAGYEEYDPETGEKLYWLLEKSLYGLKQAARNWWGDIDKWFREHGFSPSGWDPCLYIGGTDENPIFVVLYVDDLLIVGRDISEFKKAINAKYDMKELGELTYFLGLEIQRDRAARTLKISQGKYLRSILERFGMAECKPKFTPAVENEYLRPASAEDMLKP